MKNTTAHDISYFGAGILFIIAGIASVYDQSIYMKLTAIAIGLFLVYQVYTFPQIHRALKQSDIERELKQKECD